MLVGVAARRPTERGGFILLFGSKRVMSNETGEAVDARCPRCGATGSLKGIRVRQWFTIFFCPLFPLGSGQRFTQCTKCNASFAMPPEQFAGAAAKADAVQTQRSITMYNSLRNSPANSVTLNELMQLYGSLGEYKQAVSAAADFPVALNNSEQCMVTLGRVYVSQNDYAAALRWFDAALARNPDLPEAQFYKAVAHLRGTPSDPAKAIAAARMARKADYPGAGELIAEAEGGDAANSKNELKDSKFETKTGS
jgi:tetratricopeptide (TPR) repeat protein